MKLILSMFISEAEYGNISAVCRRCIFRTMMKSSRHFLCFISFFRFFDCREQIKKSLSVPKRQNCVSLINKLVFFLFLSLFLRPLLFLLVIFLQTPFDTVSISLYSRIFLSFSHSIGVPGYTSPAPRYTTGNFFKDSY